MQVNIISNVEDIYWNKFKKKVHLVGFIIKSVMMQVNIISNVEDIYWNKFKKKVHLVGSYYTNPYRRFGTNCVSLPQTYLDSWTLGMGQRVCLEILVRNYHNSPPNNPEERRFQLSRGGSLKSNECGLLYQPTSRLILKKNGEARAPLFWLSTRENSLLMEESCLLIFLTAYQDWFLQEVHKRNL